MAGFQHAIAGGQGNLVTPQLQSPNFDIATETGWAILRNGDAYFFNITAAGAVTSNTVIIKGSGDGLFVYDTGGALVLSITAENGVFDPLNGQQCAGPGISISAPGLPNEIQVRPDLSAILIYGA